ncbi:MAG TPA: hypothetical protein VLC09_18005 [Polyangiaceae bacterium]|nr:hypothetical protein [Polyangiaceae bacterium]
MESSKLVVERPQAGADTLDDDGDTQVRFLDERRSTAVWRQWLASMARDAEAALAAAIAYRDMDAAGRESWLDSLDYDAPEVDVPAFALYAPLLSVEKDAERRERILMALGPEVEAALPRCEKRALVGSRADGLRISVLVLPLYLDFVQVLACGVKGSRFEWVRHDPILLASSAPEVSRLLEGVRLERSPVKSVLDELAVAVLGHRRQGLELPEALEVLVDLLGELGP